MVAWMCKGSRADPLDFEVGKWTTTPKLSTQTFPFNKEKAFLSLFTRVDMCFLFGRCVPRLEQSPYLEDSSGVRTWSSGRMLSPKG